MKNKSLNIVIHQPRLSYYLGGGEIIPLEQAKFLTKRGHRVTILTRRHEPESPAFKKFRKEYGRKIRIVTLNLNKKQNAILNKEPGYDWYRWDAEAILFGQAALSFYQKNRTRIDLVATHLSTDSIVIPSGFKNVLHLHGEPLKISDTIRLGLLRPDGFCSVSKNVQKFWKGNIEKGRPLKLIHNGIDPVRYHPVKNNKDVDILFVGRFIKNKGILDILEAIRNIKKGKILFIGDGPLRKEIVRNAKKQTNINLLKNISEEELINYYQRAKIFICPSTKKEGVLTTMLEAAACGCSVITTGCCGMKDFAKNKINSILVEPGRPKQIKFAIQILLHNDALRCSIVKHARKDIEEEWTWGKQILKLEKFYISVCKGK